jgi:glycosyltransferase involved in cell wall biosynthesis
MLFVKFDSLFKQLEKEAEILGNPSTNPKISICLIIYNHGKFLKPAFDSIISQEFSHSFEIVVSDDGSSDDSQAIIREYSEKYPHLFKSFLHKENLSKKYSQFTPGKLNFLYGLYQCSGDYVVHIEGDDYFIDNLKLQKQFDFLESRPQYSACFHNAWMKFDSEIDENDRLINPQDQKKEILPEDLLAEKEIWFMATAAVMFRNKLVRDLPEWFCYSKSGDIPLYVILSEKAPIAYMPDIMSVYRRHLAGQSYTYDNIYDAVFIRSRIYMYDSLNTHFNGRYEALIKPILAEYYLMLAQTVQFKSRTFGKTLAILKYLIWSAKPQPHGLRFFLKIILPEWIVRKFSVSP